MRKRLRERQPITARLRRISLKPRLSSNITVNMEELGGRDVNKIDLNYKFYGFLTLCFILIPAFLQSLWSYYIYWVEDKARQEKAHFERTSYQPKFKWYKSFLFHLFPFSIVVSLVITFNIINYDIDFTVAIPSKSKNGITSL